MIRRILQRALDRSRPGHLILHVTDRCQLHCRTCFAARGKSDLPVLFIREAASYLGPIAWLEIGGGEPFLRKDLPEICSLFDAGMISIPTNGLSPDAVVSETRKILRAIKKGTELSIAVSIDGLEKTNDCVRGKGSFRKAVQTLKRLRKIEGIRVKANTVLTSENLAELPELMGFIRPLRPDFHSVILLRGKPRDPALRLPALADLRRIRGDLFRMWGSYDYGIGNPIARHALKRYQQVSYDLSLSIMEHDRQAVPCLAGTAHLVIWADGGVSFCETLPQIGTMKNDRLEDILSSPRAAAMRKKIRDGGCSCHHNCNMLDNIFFSPIQYPRLLI